MKKFTIVGSLMLAAFAATPAFAATHHARASASPSYAAAYDANASADRDLTVSGPAVYAVDGQYAGWDPDPNIRFQLMRDPNTQGAN